MTLPTTQASPVSADAMQAVYAAANTPFKYGVILRGKDNNPVDCPSVFRLNNAWWMLYVCFNKVGYETHLARSDDLLHWDTQGKVLSFRDAPAESDVWDRWQADGGIALVDPAWGGSYSPAKFDGRYWMSYIGGAQQGYEPDPLAIGLATTDDPTRAKEWHRLPENPVLSPAQTDVRDFEKKTLYKSNILWDRSETLGHPFVMFYNGKQEGKQATERIGIAVSQDMVHWTRVGREPVVDNYKGISGDPQIAHMSLPGHGDLWVMFYFGHVWQPKAFDTFAASHDLLHWTKWQGPHLVEPSEPFDQTFAHKPWIIQHDGVVYHYYCAVGTEGRVIALATSKDLGPAPSL